jgi:hypothetical protein
LTKLLNAFFYTILLCTIVGCDGLPGETQTGETKTGGIITASSGCTSNAPGLKADAVYEDNKTYVIYDYSGTTLSLKHINAVFNCCPTSIMATASVSAESIGNVLTRSIVIEESEDTSQQGCSCVCQYNLDLQVDGVTAGTYVVKFNEPYFDEPDPVIEFTADLVTQPSGTFELERPQ